MRVEKSQKGESFVFSSFINPSIVSLTIHQLAFTLDSRVSTYLSSAFDDNRTQESSSTFASLKAWKSYELESFKERVSCWSEHNNLQCDMAYVCVVRSHALKASWDYILSSFQHSGTRTYRSRRKALLTVIKIFINLRFLWSVPHC